jgi:hypothetical protein
LLREIPKPDSGLRLRSCDAPPGARGAVTLIDSSVLVAAERRTLDLDDALGAQVATREPA